MIPALREVRGSGGGRRATTFWGRSAGWLGSCCGDVGVRVRGRPIAVHFDFRFRAGVRAGLFGAGLFGSGFCSAGLFGAGFFSSFCVFGCFAVFFAIAVFFAVRGAVAARPQAGRCRRELRW